MALEPRRIKALLKRGAIYDLCTEGVKLARSEFRCGKLVQKVPQQIRMVDESQYNQPFPPFQGLLSPRKGRHGLELGRGRLRRFPGFLPLFPRFLREIGGSRPEIAPRPVALEKLVKPGCEIGHIVLAHRFIANLVQKPAQIASNCAFRSGVARSFSVKARRQITSDRGSAASITLAPGDTKTCTITNDDIGPTLTLVKTVTNNNGGNKVVSDFPLFIDGSLVTSGTANLVPANVLHTATETTQVGYAPSTWGGDCAADGTITLAPGDTKTSTITNDNVGPTLTLVKTVTNNNGGNKVVSDFPLFIDGSLVTSGTANLVPANVLHTATETTQVGYAPSTWGGDCAADGTITLAPGDTKTCTITNDDIGPTLTLVKTVTNNNGGNKVVSDFPLFIDGSLVTSGTANLVPANVLHTATETTQVGYAPSTWGGDCAADGTITLAPGDTKTCTITNDDMAAPDLVKSVTNDNGGNKVIIDFPLYTDGSLVSRARPPGAGDRAAHPH